MAHASCMNARTHLDLVQRRGHRSKVLRRQRSRGGGGGGGAPLWLPSALLAGPHSWGPRGLCCGRNAARWVHVRVRVMVRWQRARAAGGRFGDAGHRSRSAAAVVAAAGPRMPRAPLRLALLQLLEV
jgi:hypothetical protein